MRILIIEDNKVLCQTLKRGFTEIGHVVDVSNDGKSGIYFVENAEYDVIILDIMLPDINGIEVCRKLRDTALSTPILMLTAKRSVNSRVEGLNAGADDYLCKPFDFEELVARILAIHRRETAQKNPVIEAGGISLDTVSRKVMVKSSEVQLTSTEYHVLEYLMSHPDKLLTYEMLENHIWDIEKSREYNSLNVIVSRLRSKLGYDLKDCPIRNAYGEGYRFTP